MSVKNIKFCFDFTLSFSIPRWWPFRYKVLPIPSDINHDFNNYK